MKSFNHVKTGSFCEKALAVLKAVVCSGSNDSCALCLDQRRTESQLLFEIQIIGLEQDGPLLSKEVTWKK